MALFILSTTLELDSPDPCCIHASTDALDNTKSHIPLAYDIPLFTEILQKEGYEVAILGKVHTRNGVEERNWDYYFGHNSPGNDYANPFFKEGRKGKVGPEKQYEAVHPDDLTTDRAISGLMKIGGDKPFCILIWFVALHEPFFRPRCHADLYNGTPIAKPAIFRR